MAYNALRFVIKYRYALAIAAALIALYSAYAYAKGVGRDECKQAHERALFEANQKARFEIVQLEKKYDSASKKIREIPDGGCVGPANIYVNKWMQEHYISK